MHYSCCCSRVTLHSLTLIVLLLHSPDLHQDDPTDATFKMWPHCPHDCRTSGTREIISEFVLSCHISLQVCLYLRNIMVQEWACTYVTFVYNWTCSCDTPCKWTCLYDFRLQLSLTLWLLYNGTCTCNTLDYNWVCNCDKFVYHWAGNCDSLVYKEGSKCDILFYNWASTCVPVDNWIDVCLTH